MDAEKTVLVSITGRVQGVSFRAWTQAEARKLGLAGWVRNERDGSVSALLAGQEGAAPDIILLDNPAVSTLAETGMLTTMDEFGLDTSEIDQNLLAAGMVAPLRQMTEASGRMARGAYSGRVHTKATDEVGRLATAFNQMLTALDASRTRQRERVADASHELRTPLTSLRTNIDLLTMSGEGGLPAEAAGDLVGAALLDRDAVAGRERQVEGARRGRHVERDAVRLRQQRD
jgi:signal transduction histidine kinase